MWQASVGLNMAAGGWQDLIVRAFVIEAVNEHNMTRERCDVVCVIWGDSQLLRPGDLTVGIGGRGWLEGHGYWPVSGRASRESDDTVGVCVGRRGARCGRVMRAVNMLHMLLVGHKSSERDGYGHHIPCDGQFDGTCN